MSKTKKQRPFFGKVPSYKALPKNLGELQEAGWRSRSVKEEIRENLIEKLKKSDHLFNSIFGYEKTVEVEVANALLAKHNFLLLGLRGQGKTKILRELVHFLDAFLPIISGTLLREDPLNPISPAAKRLVAEQKKKTKLEWLSREARFHEKLCTPDVSIADLIGDLDPIKAAREKLDLSNEAAIHWGLIPRSNRGLLAINELPDLQPRIQVGLLNLLEERDVQVRGFPLRLPLDLLVVFSANPEDYTNRGRIITPLKDRIDSQIITHYPKQVETAKQITSSEVRLSEFSVGSATVAEPPELLKKIVEEIGFVARESELIDQASGVSQRLSISALENVIGNLMRRRLKYETPKATYRLMDLQAALPAITGKIETLEDLKQNGLVRLGSSLISEAAKKVFLSLFPKPEKFSEEREDKHYSVILRHFKIPKKLVLTESMSDKEYAGVLLKVKGLADLVEQRVKQLRQEHLTLYLELVLEGLYCHSLLRKEATEGSNLFQNPFSLN